MTADTILTDAPKTADLPAELPHAAPGKALSDAARRALAEAAARKAEQDSKAAELGAAVEINGRGGLEPVRYNDWEVKGIASDF
jgi:hypothetical protein